MDIDEKIGQFWDAHDFTDFDNPAAPDVEFETTFAVPIEAELFAALERYAHQRGAQVGQREFGFICAFCLQHLGCSRKGTEARRYLHRL